LLSEQVVVDDVGVETHACDVFEHVPVEHVLVSAEQSRGNPLQAPLMH
jgi:hypothetical protein